MIAELDPKKRFSSRVEDYLRYRPGYPASVLRALREELALDATWVVADVGSGTGFSTELSPITGWRVDSDCHGRRGADVLLDEQRIERHHAGEAFWSRCRTPARAWGRGWRSWARWA